MYTSILKKARNKFSDTRTILFDSIILCTSILFMGIYLNYIEASELLYEYTRNHEEYELDEIILTFALSSFLFMIFILRRFFELKYLIKKANTDPLIGILNRRKGAALIKNEIDFLLDKKYHSSLIMLDIDNFKNINDSCGHDVGDLVLKELSSILHKAARKSDRFIRWGGEEFIILCSYSNRNNASILAERFRKVIQEYQFSCKFEVTASFGVVELNKEDELRVQIEKVDKNLYLSKNEGKNRVTVS